MPVSIKNSYIFSLTAKSDMQVSCVIFWRSQSYIIFAITYPTGKYNFALAKYHCVSNLTCRKVNIVVWQR